MQKSELIKVQSSLTRTYAEFSNKFMFKFRFATPECLSGESVLKELLLYSFVLSTWQQTEDGTPIDNVNHINLEQFNFMINRIKELT